MSTAKRIVVIGGSAAGPKAAAKARRMDEHASITLIQKSKELSMASCGYPYYVGGVFDDRNLLLCTPTGVVRNPQFYQNAKNIDARTETEALSIDRSKKTVLVRHLPSGKEEAVPYDTLVIATGAEPVIPPIPGIDLDGITTLQSLNDADYLRKVCDEERASRALVVGGGLIGIETCEALELAGIPITLVERLPQLLPFLDWEIARSVENHVRSKSVKVILDNAVAHFQGENGKLTGAVLQDGTVINCNLAVIAVGVKPRTALARDAGIAIGQTGGIVVDEYMQTSDPAIYAAGDCVEITQLITNEKVHAPFGDLANLEGRVAGQNAAVGNRAVFRGTVQTGICKIFDYAAGSTGLSEKSARRVGGFDIETLIVAGLDKPGFMSGKALITKMTVEKETGRILGAQCVGMGDVSKQIASWAVAIQAKMSIFDLQNLDLPYAPPFSLAVDHMVAAAHCMENKLEGRLKSISAEMLKQKLDSREPLFVLDVRGPDEFEMTRLGIGETLIPLGALRKRLDELPKDKETEIVCYCKISLRGYEAALILEGHGYKNVRVLEGGILAWPYGKEK